MQKLLFVLKIFIIMLLQVGCYTNYHYTVKPKKTPINNDSIHLGFNRVYFDEEKMKYSTLDIQHDGHSKDATFRVMIIYSTESTKNNLNNLFIIENVEVNTGFLDVYTKLDKYSDTIETYFKYSLQDSTKNMRRICEFGPFKIDGNMPDSAIIGFDLNIMNEIGDSVIDKRHIEAVAKLNRKSTIKAAFEL